MAASAIAGGIKLLLVDDHVMFRESLVCLLESSSPFKVVGHAGTVGSALEILESTDANIVLLDADLGSERGIDLIKAARQRGFQGQFMVLTGGVSDFEAIRLVQAGVSAILHKHNASEVLFRAILQIAAGEVLLEKVYLEALLHSLDPARAGAQSELNDRDRNLLRLILQGFSNGEICSRLKISQGTVKSSLRHVCEKLGVRTRSQLVRVAIEQYRDQLQ